MPKSVTLYLAFGVSLGIGFWDINFTENDEFLNLADSKFLECYRKEVFGIDAAIAVRQSIKSTLDILVSEINNDGYNILNPPEGYSPEIPLNIIEDTFDLWAYNFQNEYLWLKYTGILKFRKKMKQKNNFVSNALKGHTYDFAIKLEKILSFRPVNLEFKMNTSKELMW